MSEEQEMIIDCYSTLQEFLNTQKCFADIRKKRKKTEKQIETERIFTSSVRVKKNPHYTVPNFPEKWRKYLEPAQSLIEDAISFVNEQIDDGNFINPPNDKLFRAFELIKPKNVKVIIFGQDPYPKPGAANGLAFSCDGPIQNSLQNIFTEINNEYGSKPSSGNLERWSTEEGVLLLNSCLTVNQNDPGSHGKCWTPTIVKIMEKFFRKKLPVVIVLLGAQAKVFFEKAKFSYSQDKTEIVTAGHPSSRNASNPFIGSGVFKRVNRRLKKLGLKKVNWTD